MKRLRTWRASLAIALVLACAAAQVGSGLHVLLVQHVTCEHGDLIHVGVGVGVGSAHGDAAKAPAPAAVSPDQQRSQAGDVHEHCVASQLTSSQSSIGPKSPAPAGLAPPALVELTVCAPLPARAPTLALYRLAPKNSPPAHSAS